MNEYIWTEKHRPAELCGIEMSQNSRDMFEKFIESTQIPHLLFFGPPGTGKTTTSLVLIKKLDADYIILNASDERGIDTIRNKVKMFASSKPLKHIKIVFLDEADALTKDAQQTLRNIMETYHKHTRFILTANYENKIILPIRSRCIQIRFKKVNNDMIKNTLKNILDIEKIKYVDDDINKIIKMSHGDLRKGINLLQKLSCNGTLIIIDEKHEYNTIYTMLTEKNILGIREFFSKNSVDWDGLYRYLYEKETNPKNILTIAKFNFQNVMVADSEINFLGLAVSWV